MKTKKFTLIEVIIPASVASANSRVYVGNQPQLQSISGDKNIWIKAVEAYSVEQITKSPLTGANAVASVAAIKNATLTIVVKGTEELQQIPLAILCRNINGTQPATWDPFLLDNLYQVDWSKSYLQLVEAPAAAPFSYVFGIHYAEQADISADPGMYQR